jgi:tetratricopeptide (TPR) repeat protein
VTDKQDSVGERLPDLAVHAERDAYVAEYMQVHHHPRPERVVPRQLPAATRHFAGRTAELQRLTGLLDQGAGAGGTVVISAIGGTAGVGKTALAVCWAHRVADRFPDGQLYVNLRGFDPTGAPVKPAEAVRGFLDAFAVPVERIPVGLDAQAALYRSLVAGKRMLVVLDNAYDAEQVRPLLPGSPGGLVVVTSRNQLTSLVAAEGAHPLTLNLLTVDEAWELLAGRLGPDRLAAEPQAVDEILARCARLPLALVIVAARAAAHPAFPLSVLDAELHDAGARLDALDAGDAPTNLRAVFSWSYQALAPDAARLFRLLGLHPGPDISIPAAASLAGIRPVQVGPLLAELARANLTVESTPGRYTFHDLLRAYAGELALGTDHDDERPVAVHRVLDHYLHTARIAVMLLNPHRHPITLPPPEPGVTPEHLASHDQAMAWFTTERPVLLAVIHHAASIGFDTHICHLVSTLELFLHRQGHWQDWAMAEYSALQAAQRLADRRAKATAHSGLGGACARLGRYDDAGHHYRQALDLYAELGDRTGQARLHFDLCWVFGIQGRHQEALDHARHTLILYSAIDDRAGQARAQSAVGYGHALLGDYQRALTECQQALVLLQEIGDRITEASTWDSLGYAHHHLGQHTQALSCYHHALALQHELGDRHSEAAVLCNLGDTYHAAGNTDAARDAWQQALTILDQLDHPDADAVRTKLAALDITTDNDPS